MRASALTGAAAAATALAVVLSGCGSDKPAASPSSSSSTSTSSKTSSTTKTATSEAAPVGDPTIADYLNQNGGTKIATPGKDGAPTIGLPTPDGWEQFTDDLIEGAFGGIRYTGPEAATVQPKIFANLQQVGPGVDANTVIEFAPNELLGLPGYEPAAEGSTAELGGYPAYQLAGTYLQDGRRTLIAQKTVVIPGDGALFMLQLNAAALPEQQEVVGAALDAIDTGTTITF